MNWQVDPPWPLPPITPEELETRHAMENTTPAERLRAMEAADPSQTRPMKRPNIMDKVAFLDPME
jgi:hypothetical protein